MIMVSKTLLVELNGSKLQVEETIEIIKSIDRAKVSLIKFAWDEDIDVVVRVKEVI